MRYAGVRAVQDQGLGAAGVAERELLGDQAAHAKAEDVCPVDAGRIEDGDCVGRHRGEVERFRGGPGTPHTAVVERDHPVAVQPREQAEP